MHINVLILTTNKMNTPSHLHTNSWLLLLPKTSQPEYLGWGNPVLRGTQKKSFPVQYMHQGTVGMGPGGMASHPIPEGVLGLLPPCTSKEFTALHLWFGWT